MNTKLIESVTVCYALAINNIYKIKISGQDMED